MDNCKYCNKELENKRLSYCDLSCNRNYLKVGAAKEPYVYNESDQPDVSILKEGAWLMFTSDQTDEQCVADFMRAWERAPEWVIYDPKTPDYKFVGPVWDEEEMARRWQGDK